MQVIRIPHERIQKLIGKNGESKEIIEKKGKVKISISDDGEVHIEGDSVDEYIVREIVKAIGRGFETDDALLLLNPNFSFELINLKEVAKSENDLRRIKGRIIGSKGKIKKKIENVCEAKIAVYGGTIGVIAPITTINYAIRIIEKIIEGAKHSTVYNELAKIKKEIMAVKLIEKDYVEVNK